MAQYLVDIEKKLGAEYWTNIYHLVASGLPDAVTAAADIAAAEVAIHHDTVYFTNYRVSEKGSPGVFSVIKLNTYGAATGEANLMPLFVVQVCEFNPVVGRSSKKYLRGLLREDLVVFDAVSSAYVNGAVQDYCDAVLAVAGIADEHGNPFVTAAGSEIVGMRQLRRSGKRPQIP